MKKIILFPGAVNLISFLSEDFQPQEVRDRLLSLIQMTGEVQNSDDFLFHFIVDSKELSENSLCRQRIKEVLAQFGHESHLIIPVSSDRSLGEVKSLKNSDVTIFDSEKSKELNENSLKKDFGYGQVIYINRNEKGEIERGRSFSFREGPFRSINTFLRSMWMLTFTGDKNSQCSFLDYFLGIPGTSNAILNIKGKIMLWGIYCFGGFIFYPLKNIAKLIFELPLNILREGFKDVYYWLGKMATADSRNKKIYNFLRRFVAMPMIGITGFFLFGLVRPILSPIDNVRYLVRKGNKLTGIKKIFNRISIGVSVTVTTLFYISLMALTAALVVPLVVPTAIVTLPILYTTAGVIVNGLTSLFGSFTAAVATAIVATSLPIVTFISNGIRSLVEEINRAPVTIKGFENLNSFGNKQTLQYSADPIPVNGISSPMTISDFESPGVSSDNDSPVRSGFVVERSSPIVSISQQRLTAFVSSTDEVRSQLGLEEGRPESPAGVDLTRLLGESKQVLRQPKVDAGILNSVTRQRPYPPRFSKEKVKPS